MNRDMYREKSFLLQVLSRRDALSSEDEALIELLPVRRAAFKANAEMVAEGSRPLESCLVVKGFAARTQSLSEGQRQIAAIHLPGDFVDLHGFLLKTMDHSVIAVGPCEAVFIAHASLMSITEGNPHLARLFWMLTAIDAAIQRTWITCLGRRSSEQHMAHLICELFVRLDVVGLVHDRSFEFPMTQTQLGDTLGMSVVHTNRTLQDLRSAGLVQWQGTLITVSDFDALADLAEFDPTYLSLTTEPR